jgi:hypothetical protein
MIEFSTAPPFLLKIFQKRWDFFRVKHLSGVLAVPDNPGGYQVSLRAMALAHGLMHFLPAGL